MILASGVHQDLAHRSSWQPLREILAAADRTKTAVGHFNASELIALKGIAAAALELNVPVIVGASEKERAFAGVRQLAALVQSIRKEHDVPIFLNADHTYSLRSALEAARAGFDAIGFDASALPFEDNVRETKRAVEALKEINPAILVEGEIGNIGTGSRIHQCEPQEARVLTSVVEASQFVKATGVDLLAPAVGNMHGLTPEMVTGHKEKRLDIKRIAAIKSATGAYMTLHGGSATNEADFIAAIRAGITVIHINTELRVALRRGLVAGLAQEEGDVTPYVILQPAVEAVREVVRTRLQLFQSVATSAEATA
jgi:fructose-bisphosphate aldolase class II